MWRGGDGLLTSAVGLPPSTLVLAAVALLVGGFARGYSGFGLTAILIPVLAFVMPTAEIVPCALALEVVASAGQARSALPNTDWRQVGLLMVGSAVGVPLGVAALALGDPAVMRLVALVCLLGATVGLLAGLQLGRRSGGAAATALAGFVVGVITGCAGVGGLFLVIYLTALATAPERLRGTIISYFFVLDIVAVAALWQRGLFEGEEVMRTLAAVPLMTLGIVLGSRHFLSASPESFRRYTLIFLVVLSTAGLVAAFFGAI